LDCEGGLGQFGQVGCGLGVDLEADKILVDLSLDSGGEFAVGLVVDFVEDKAVWVGGRVLARTLRWLSNQKRFKTWFKRGGSVFESWILSRSPLPERHQNDAVGLIAPGGGEEYDFGQM
jgi:hypothetical protein